MKQSWIWILSFFHHLSIVQMLQQYTIYLTQSQIKVMVDTTILEFQHKKCIVRQGKTPKLCQQYCQIFYDYVPELPYKNAQKFNSKTGLCQPRKICPNLYGVSYSSYKDQCFDILTGMAVQPINASPNTEEKEKVVVICENGKITEYHGKLDCECDLGWTTRLQPNLISREPQFKKCNQAVPISLYFPNTLKVFYDPEQDNSFPYGNDPNYWGKLLGYWMRQIKYSILTFFQPYEAEMVSMILPKQQMISKEDWIWFTWICIFLGLLLGLSLFHKALYGSSSNIEHR